MSRIAHYAQVARTAVNDALIIARSRVLIKDDDSAALRQLADDLTSKAAELYEQADRKE